MGKYIKQNAEDWTKVGARVTKVDSTNDSLRQQVQAFAKTGQVLPEGYSLTADYQSAGKGRLGRIWEAKAGENLLISYLYSSAGLKPDQLFLLLQSIALAVRDTIASYAGNKDVKVKWPNDIFLGEQKIAGILIESMLLGDEVSCVIVGIGINVNQLQFKTGIKATSLAIETHQYYQLKAVQAHLSLKLQAEQQALKEIVRVGDFYPLQQRYHANLFAFGEWAVFEEPNTSTVHIGKILGVLKSGHLRLEIDEEECRYSLDDIQFVRKREI